MRLAELFESPDFGYSTYNDRENDLKQVSIKVDKSSYGFRVYAALNDLMIGYISCERSTDTYFPEYRKVIRVSRSKIDADWFGTGLGQMLYDKAIQEAKRRGYLKFRSDVLRSKEGDAAWKRLGTRYKVDVIQSPVLDYFAYEIDLTKVPKKINESPDFGYSKFNDKEDELKDITWKVEKFHDGFVIRPYYKNSSMGRISCKYEQPNGVRVSNIVLGQFGEYWKGSGLGQMMYDKAIEYTKSKGFDKFLSDNSRTSDANNAWTKRLNKRYPVQYDKKQNRFVIDLTKVPKKINESPDFGYSKFNDKEDDFKKISFREIPWGNNGYQIEAWFNRRKVGYIKVSFDKAASIMHSSIDKKWTGTGLGQTLYDKAIQSAKDKGCSYIRSDITLSPDAISAWKKLSKRYTVQHNTYKDGTEDRYYKINLK